MNQEIITFSAAADAGQPTTPVNNAIYLRRRGRIALPPPARGADAVAAASREPLDARHIASVMRNLETLGYTFAPDLIDACRALSLGQFVALYQGLVADLQKLVGAHRKFKPFYPNFPEQVMKLDEAELYLNALVHYATGGRLRPASLLSLRPALREKTDATPIGLGTPDEFAGLFALVAGANAALSDQDKEDLAWFAAAYGDKIAPLLPDALPQKENVAVVAGLLLQHVSDRDAAVELVGRYVKTATDVLRLAVALSGGDVSLALPTKFRALSRPERALLLALLERVPYPTLVEDMLRWKGRWVRLGERLHPGEHARKFPNAARAFAVLRNDEPFVTFNGGVERALADKNAAGALARLSARPGDLARRLDHLLRLDPADTEAQAAVIAAFSDAARRVSTPVLLQVRHHFLVRKDAGDVYGLRVFLPKGNVAKAHAEPNTLPAMPDETRLAVVEACEAALVERFAALPPLGRVFVDPALRDFMVPFALRSASRSLRTLVRGSRLPLPPACAVLRFFVWWKNGKDGRERTDIDLSATLFDTDFNYVDILSYYNLKGFGGVHSGDIVEAPNGAAEFIDVSLARLREKNVRYVVMTLNSYSEQPYCDLPECFAGWMARQEAGSGEIFEPRTVQDRLDLTADTRVAIPLVIDVEDGKVVWCDMALRRDPRWVNNVHGNLGGIALTLRSLVSLPKPNLYDLFDLHARARGSARVASLERPEDADTVFSVENGTPFRLEEIAAQYMA